MSDENCKDYHISIHDGYYIVFPPPIKVPKNLKKKINEEFKKSKMASEKNWIKTEENGYTIYRSKHPIKEDYLIIYNYVDGDDFVTEEYNSKTGESKELSRRSLKELEL